MHISRLDRAAQFLGGCVAMSLRRAGARLATDLKMPQFTGPEKGNCKRGSNHETLQPLQVGNLSATSSDLKVTCCFPLCSMPWNTFPTLNSDCIEPCHVNLRSHAALCLPLIERLRPVSMSPYQESAGLKIRRQKI